MQITCMFGEKPPLLLITEHTKAVLSLKCSVSYNVRVSLGNRVATFFWKGLPTLLAIFLWLFNCICLYFTLTLRTWCGFDCISSCVHPFTFNLAFFPSFRSAFYEGELAGELVLSNQPALLPLKIDLFFFYMNNYPSEWYVWPGVLYPLLKRCIDFIILKKKIRPLLVTHSSRDADFFGSEMPVH